jgi:hypothetical protein
VELYGLTDPRGSGGLLEGFSMIYEEYRCYRFTGLDLFFLINLLLGGEGFTG